MNLEYIIDYNGKLIDTCTNKELSRETLPSEIKKLERKNNIRIFKNIIHDNLFYKYDIEQHEKTIKLIVYKGSYLNKINWLPIYSASITLNKIGIQEEGDLDLEFWHEYFATCYGLMNYNELNVSLFSLNKNPMKVVRTIFTTHLEDNVFLFFKKYRNSKKVNEKTYDTNIFNNIKPIKLNKNVGKTLDSNLNQYYAFQKEIIINNEVFFDVTLIVGPVHNGIMDIKEKHRFFITENYAYSPTNSDLRILIDNYIHGKIYDKLMKTQYPSLMLDKYKSKKYYYAYLLSKNFLPAFEILVKAEFNKLADLCLDNYYYKLNEFNKNYKSKTNIDTFKINLYGKNDKEIFGFKLKTLKNVHPDCYELHGSCKESFTQFITDVTKIVNNAPNILNQPIDSEMFEFILLRYTSKTLSKEITYLKNIGTYNQSLYADYLRLCSNANKYSGGLYPKNLKHEHDVMVTYTQELKETENNKVFEGVVSSVEYQTLLYTGEKYCILAPRQANDLVMESYQLSHCVRGYISDVARKYTKIYFMRLVDKKSKPLITLEVRDNKVKQARGKANRHLTQEEDNFVQEWMNNKGLSDNYHLYPF